MEDKLTQSDGASWAVRRGHRPHQGNWRRKLRDCVKGIQSEKSRNSGDQDC